MSIQQRGAGAHKSPDEGSKEGADRSERRQPGSEAESKSKTSKKWGRTEAARKGQWQESLGWGSDREKEEGDETETHRTHTGRYDIG